MERVLGISYPTIRNKLDEINSILNRNNDTIILPDKTTGSAAEKKAASVEDIRKDILQQVSDGRLSPAEAVQKLKDLQG